jgi:hypothetical protein
VKKQLLNNVNHRVTPHYMESEMKGKAINVHKITCTCIFCSFLYQIINEHPNILGICSMNQKIVTNKKEITGAISFLLCCNHLNKKLIHKLRDQLFI